jgi:hypothetical protein
VNGIVYGEWSKAREKKLKWCRSKFYQSIRRLIDAGLIERHGDHYRLIRGCAMRFGLTDHRCTLRIRKHASQREVRDHVILKLVEMAHRQVCHAILPTVTAKNERIRILEQMERERYHPSAETKTEHHLGSTRDQMVRSAEAGYAPLNTRKLMITTGLRRAALFTWKKRSKKRHWIKQQDRCFHIPPEIAVGLPDYNREVEIMFRGAVVATKYGYKFRQASLYRMCVNYEHHT